jgi:hypothetical protein
MDKLPQRKVGFLLLVLFILIGPGVLGAGRKLESSRPQAEHPMVERPPVVLRADPWTSNLRILPPQQFSALRVQNVTIVVDYIPNGSTDRWGTICLAWPAEAKTAFDYAASIWESLITSTVSIHVNACWANLPSGVLGYGGARYHLMSGVYYPMALANALAGFDRNGAAAEMDVAYTASTTAVPWYFGTNGLTPSGSYDFASVVLHEIGHGLGFAGSMQWDDGIYDPGQGNYEECDGVADEACWGGWTTNPYRYDQFTENGLGQRLINTALFGNPSDELATQLTSGDIFFDGARARLANGGSPPELYAPAAWKPGSSYSHLDESYNGTVNDLMTYSLPKGQSTHSPGPVTMGVLQDLGWDAAGITLDERAYVPLVASDLNPSSGWLAIMTEDFEGTFPGAWSVYDNDFPPAHGEYCWAQRSCQAYAGSHSGWAVGGGTNGAGLGCGSNYPNDADSWMVYGPFSLVGATAADLSFKLWLDSEYTSGTKWDGVCRFASPDGFYFSGYCRVGNTGGWVDQVLDLGDLAGRPSVWVALVFTSDASISRVEGAHVDDIVLRKCISGSCEALPAAVRPSDSGLVADVPAKMTLVR